MREDKLPLRTVLENFINHVDSLEAENGGKEEQYEQQFQELKKLTEGLKNDPEYACIEGEEECNRRKNRYKDILPYDRTRVVLRPFPGVPGSDYVNANYIRGASGSRAYIASQGPLPHTVADFWRMVVECDVQVIVMASNETEGGKHKCECYWVECPGEEKQFGNVNVSFVKSRQVCPDFLVRTFKIKFLSEKNKTEERTICQFHYILWPDHGVPDTVRPLLDMVRLVRDCQASETLPVLVHCSAGCGRTGTICAIDYVWGLLRTGKLTENLDLFGLVKEMRRQRVAMVQTREQYTLLHQAVKELFRERLKLIDSHPYENIATDGNPLILREKESDYEELFVSQEKQDKSTKTSTPTNTPSDSLTRRSPKTSSRAKEERDLLRKSASTSSLDGLHNPPLPNKPAKPFLLSLALSQSALPAMTDSGSPTKHSLPPFPTQPGTFASYLSDTDLQLFKRRPPSGYSKMEKDAENIAQKMESREREKKAQSLSLSLLSQRSSTSSSASNTPYNTPAVTPSGNSSNNLSGFGLLTAPNPPAPPIRSRTPSPIISLRRSMDMLPNGQKRLANPSQVTRIISDKSPELKRKSTDIVRRPSIQKLKELFEKSTDGDIRPAKVRLSRSASSVTTKSNFSVHSSSNGPLNMRRNGSLGSEENLCSKKLYDSSDPSNKIHICPPPPPLKDPNRSICQGRLTNVYQNVSSKLSSSPVVNSSGAQRQCQIFSESKDEVLQHFPKSEDHRPALPVKKSKSFRWSRPESSPVEQHPIARSPELPKRKYNDYSTYFSLERSKPEYSGANRPEIPMKKHVEDFLSPKEGFKLSVYQHSPVDSPQSSESVDGARVDSKPSIPPKRTIGERVKNVKVVPSQPLPHSYDISDILPSDKIPTPLTSPAASSSLFDDNPILWTHSQESLAELLYDKLPIKPSKLPEKDLTEPGSKSKSSYSSMSEPSAFSNKEYVNARVIKSQLEDSSKLLYVPVPSKRTVKGRHTHDYANFDIGSKDRKRASKEHKLTVSQYPDAENRDSSSSKDDSSCEADPKAFTSQRQDLSLSSDYEPMDFGERPISVDEVFETVNYELLGSKEGSHKKKSCKNDYSSKEFYLNRDLDFLARQVYQDCQDYLLHGTNRSPVPSLMPKSKEDSDKSNCSDRSSDDVANRLVESLADLEEIKSKVAVPPQGLRNRERRDSYRQAVSPCPANHSKYFDSHGHLIPRKNMHKYEKIWFDGPRAEGRVADSSSYRYRRIRPPERDGTKKSEDLASNLNRQMNITGKEDLFKDKLVELQNLVSNLEEKKVMQLPDLSEEELSSKDSGSTSSLLSKSGQSSKPNDKNEPIYANSGRTSSGNHHRSCNSTEQREPKRDFKHPDHTKVSSSYGTMATASHPYKPKPSTASNLFSKSMTSNSLPTNYQKIYMSTLPARPVASTELSTHLPKQYDRSGNPSNVRCASKSSSSHTSSSASSSSCSSTSHRRNEHHVAPVNRVVGHAKASYKKVPTRSHVTPGDTTIIGASDLDKTTLASLSTRKNKSLAESSIGNVSTSPYLHPPPPKPFLPSSSKYHQHHQSSLITKSATTASAEVKPHGSNGLSPTTNINNNHVRTLQKNITDNHVPTSSNSVLPTDTSATDTSDDEEGEGIFHKLSPNFWTKFMGNSNRVRDGQKSPVPSKSSFYSIDTKDPQGDNGPLSTPGSPKPFVKAFGKLKLGSKSVAANFRSYLKGDRSTDELSNTHNHFHQSLQKSASSGPAVGIFNQVVRDYKYPLSIPKKPQGPKDSAISEESDPSGSRPRQQYL